MYAKLSVILLFDISFNNDIPSKLTAVSMLVSIMYRTNTEYKNGVVSVCLLVNHLKAFGPNALVVGILSNNDSYNWLKHRHIPVLICWLILRWHQINWIYFHLQP